MDWGRMGIDNTAEESILTKQGINGRSADEEEERGQVPGRRERPGRKRDLQGGPKKKARGEISARSEQIFHRRGKNLKVLGGEIKGKGRPGNA